jgi:hypothetical protein
MAIMAYIAPSGSKQRDRQNRFLFAPAALKLFLMLRSESYCQPIHEHREKLYAAVLDFFSIIDASDVARLVGSGLEHRLSSVDEIDGAPTFDVLELKDAAYVATQTTVFLHQLQSHVQLVKHLKNCKG